MKRYLFQASMILVLLSLLMLPSYSRALQSGYELDDVVRSLIPSVVLIVGIGDGITLGTGFIITDDGQVVTNHHVIEGADEIYAIWDSTVGRDYEECTVLNSDEGLDIALLSLPGSDYKPAPIAKVERAEIADDIICLGFPIVTSDDFSRDTFNIAVTRGIIASLQRNAEGDIIEVWTDAAITYGNSGGPLYDIDLDGIIGINNLFAPEASGNYNLAIPYSRFEDELYRWNHKSSSRPERDLMKQTPGDILRDARALYDEGNTDDAIEMLVGAVVKLKPGETTEIKLQLADWYIEREEFVVAYNIYKDLGDDRPDDTESLTTYGVLAYHAGEYDEAVKILLPHVGERDELVFIALALSYYELKQYTEAGTYAALALDVAESEDVIKLAEDVIAKIGSR